jgi:hypothetical protein
LILNIGAKPVFIVVNTERKVNKVAKIGSIARSAAERYHSEDLLVRSCSRFGSAPVKYFVLFLDLF